MDNKIKSNDPANENRQQSKRKSDSVAQNNCASGTRTSKTTEQSEKAPSPYIRWSLLFEFVLVIATCATVGVARSQWKAMEAQSKIMKEQLLAMSDQTKAAVQQVKIANDALEDSRKSGAEQTERAEKTLNATLENFRLEQRAWVGIRYIIDDGGGYGPFLKEGQKFNIKIGINNTGKSLAKNVKVSLTAQRITTGNDPIKKQTSAKTINIGVIHPDSWTDLIPPSIGVVTASDIENIKNGRHTLYLTGKIIYEDAFKRTHETIFCKQLSPDLSGFAACPFYNNAD